MPRSRVATGSSKKLELVAQLARVYAVRERNKITQERLIFKALQAGLPQQQISKSLGISQPAVSRMKQFFDDGYKVERTPREVILEFLSEDITREQMITELSNWDYTFAGIAEPDDSESVLTSGTWTDVDAAYFIGQIDEEAYMQILTAVAARRETIA